MWYVIQTVTGKEEELITFIKAILNKELYTDCFVIKAEWMKRLGGEWQVQIKPLFPGYVFIETEAVDEVFLELKRVPRFSKLLGDGRLEFVAVRKAEEKFLRLLTGTKEKVEEFVIKLTYVKMDKDERIHEIGIPLFYVKNRIMKINFHKRYAVIKIQLLGKEKTMILGIQLAKDKMLESIESGENNVF